MRLFTSLQAVRPVVRVYLAIMTFVALVLAALMVIWQLFSAAYSGRVPLYVLLLGLALAAAFVGLSYGLHYFWPERFYREGYDIGVSFKRDFGEGARSERLFSLLYRSVLWIFRSPYYVIFMALGLSTLLVQWLVGVSIYSFAQMNELFFVFGVLFAVLIMFVLSMAVMLTYHEYFMRKVKLRYADREGWRFGYSTGLLLLLMILPILIAQSADANPMIREVYVRLGIFMIGLVPLGWFFELFVPNKPRVNSMKELEGLASARQG